MNEAENSGIRASTKEDECVHCRRKHRFEFEHTTDQGSKKAVPTNGTFYQRLTVFWTTPANRRAAGPMRSVQRERSVAFPAADGNERLARHGTDVRADSCEETSRRRQGPSPCPRWRARRVQESCGNTSSRPLSRRPASWSSPCRSSARAPAAPM